MATTPDGKRLTQRHQRSLLAIKGQAVKNLMEIWPDLDWVQFEKVWPEWVSFAYRICAENREGATVLTEAYLKNHRLAEGVPGDMVPVLADALDRAMFETSMNATARKRLMDAAYQSSLIENPDERRMFLMAERKKALTESSGAFARHVLNGSRETQYRTMRADREALGWARVTDGDPCAFCAMLAGRGPVYKSEATSTGQWHDMCGCSAELVYSDNYEVLGKAEQIQDVWYESTSGLSGKSARQAFARAWEQRRGAL